MLVQLGLLYQLERIVVIYIQFTLLIITLVLFLVMMDLMGLYIILLMVAPHG
jgi:hypothetical protein